MKLDKKAKEQLVDFLLTQPHAKLSPSGKELTFRCPFCSDSRKSLSETNFSINVECKEDAPMLYQCFRVVCQVRGRVDQDFLTMLGFYKHDVIREINSYNKSITKKSDKKFSANQTKELTNIINTTNQISEVKLAYVNNRLGTNLTFKDVYDLKINLSLMDLLKFNNVPIPDKKDYYYQQLSDYGVSFISAYNDYVIIRDISKSGKLKKRYTNINIFDNYENVNKLYVIPGQIDLLYPEPIVLNVSEGAFDILGVYFNTKIDRKYKNQIYAAACGAGIVNLVRHFIRMYGLIDLKINIFSDSDAEKDKYKQLIDLKPYLNDFDVTVYYNKISKDFGVPKDQIDYISSKL